MRSQQLAKPRRPRDVIASVLAAGIGVQSEKNRERDFTSGAVKHCIAVGIAATLLFDMPD